jgi:hypothetical protein
VVSPTTAPSPALTTSAASTTDTDVSCSK